MFYTLNSTFLIKIALKVLLNRKYVVPLHSQTGNNNTSQ